MAEELPVAAIQLMAWCRTAALISKEELVLNQIAVHLAEITTFSKNKLLDRTFKRIPNRLPSLMRPPSVILSTILCYCQQ